jgi:hypothetical protein
VRAWLCGAAALLAACGPGAPKTGTAELRFAVSDMVRNSGNLKDPLLGTVHGSIFLAEDVGITGPHDGVMGFQDILVTNVDLRTDMASIASLVTKALEPNTYVFLGFLDVDANGANGDPDPGDPATLALTNKFDITAGAQVKRLVLFEIVYN